MCVGCHGTCGGQQSHEDRPRFTRPPGGPDLRVVGTANGPTTAPDSVVRQVGGLITYEDLYTTLGPDGRPALAVLPGTFGSYAQKRGRA